MFTFANSRPITRRRYAHLSKDIRREKREQLDSSEIKSKKAQEKLASKAQKEKNNTDMSPAHQSPLLPPHPA
jgi:transposase